MARRLRRPLRAAPGQLRDRARRVDARAPDPAYDPHAELGHADGRVDGLRAVDYPRVRPACAHAGADRAAAPAHVVRPGTEPRRLQPGDDRVLPTAPDPAAL